MNDEPAQDVAPPRRYGKVVGWVTVLVIGTLVAALALWLQRRRVTVPQLELGDIGPVLRRILIDARQAVVEDPHSEQTWGELGLFLLAHDYFKQAQVCFAHCETLNGNKVSWPHLRGVCLEQLESAEAVPALQRTIQLAGEDVVPTLRLAELLVRLDRLSEAEARLRNALQRQPENARTPLNLGNVLLIQGELPEAREVLQLVARQRPEMRPRAR